jgi:hypothetical protein
MPTKKGSLQEEMKAKMNSHQERMEADMDA